MALATNLVANGRHHALAQGNVVAGAGFGEVAAAGDAQIFRLLLPFTEDIFRLPGFEEQCYVTFRSLDGLVTGVVLDAVPFETDPGTGLQILRLNIDVLQLPANVHVLVESHHSAGR